MRLGFIGLGRMGLPMCERLVAAGFDVVATDLRPGLREQVSARWADGPARVADGVGLVVTMLPGIEEVAGVADELASALAPGACWIEMSSAAPRVARACRARGVRFVDAPVGGDPAAARDGRLLVFAGGEAADLEPCRPALDVLADRILHVGPSGSGYATKLLVNALWFTHAAASAEALTLGRRLGLDFDLLLGALRASAADSRFLADYADPLLDGDDLATFGLARCCEELSAVVTLAEELDVSLDVISAVSELHGSALERYGDVDGELLAARLVAERSGVTLRRD
jgi:3-hydroxyisobutyrate dehydrogenase-like beta-hydroxyacid dehydrogenase